MTFRTLNKVGSDILEKAGVLDAGIDAYYLLEWVCKIDRNYYLLHADEEVGPEKENEYMHYLKKRSERIPLQYITGEQEFMGFTFHVNPNVLVPRQDTEILVDEARKRLTGKEKVLDVCTGSGCIIISLKKLVPEIDANASDVSKQALAVAKENARNLDVAVNFMRSDMFSQITGKYDMIVSNPPYIRTEEIGHLMPEVRDYEPVMALDGMEDGLFFYRQLASDSKRFLNQGGTLIMEIGCDQADDVSLLLENEGFNDIKVVKDLAGLNRVVIGVIGNV